MTSEDEKGQRPATDADGWDINIYKPKTADCNLWASPYAWGTTRRRAEPESRPARNDSRWEDPGDFRSTLTRHCLDDAEYPLNSGGVPLAYDGRYVYVDSGDSHVFIPGSTGSKKSRLVCMPAIRMLTKAGESMVITDPKGELYDKTAADIRAHGYHVVVINLRDPLKGSCWNPLSVIYRLYKSENPLDKDKARELMLDFAKNTIPLEDVADPFWNSTAQNLLYGLIATAVRNAESEDQVNLVNVCRLKSQIYADDDSIYRFMKKLDKNSTEYIALCSAMNTAETTRRCISSVFDQHMSIFYTQEILGEMMSASDVDLSTVGDERTAIFVITPDEKTTLNPIVSAFVKQCYEMLIMSAQRKDDRKLVHRVNFVLDEFASLSEITDMSSMISAGRSRNIRFFLVVQSIRQLYSRYREDAYTIRANCGCWIFLTSREVEMLDEICRLAGEGADGHPLITPSRLQRLDKGSGEVLILSGRSYPIISHLRDIDDLPGGGPHCPIPPRERHVIASLILGRRTSDKEERNNRAMDDLSDFLGEFGLDDDDGI